MEGSGRFTCGGLKELINKRKYIGFVLHYFEEETVQLTFVLFFTGKRNQRKLSARPVTGNCVNILASVLETLCPTSPLWSPAQPTCFRLSVRPCHQIWYRHLNDGWDSYATSWTPSSSRCYIVWVGIEWIVPDSAGCREGEGYLHYSELFHKELLASSEIFTFAGMFDTI